MNQDYFFILNDSKILISKKAQDFFFNNLNYLGNLNPN